MRIFTGDFAQTFPNRIHPDVGGDAANVLVISEQVFVKVPLPKARASVAKMQSRRMPFESPDEAKKICLFVSALHQDMQMIGHQAPGMKEESRNGSILFENVDDFFSQGTVGERLCALCGTNRHEVRSPAGVIVPCKVKAFSLSQSLRIIAYSHGNAFCRARRWLSGRARRHPNGRTVALVWNGNAGR